MLEPQSGLKVGEDGLELLVPLTLLPESWAYRCVPSCVAKGNFWVVVQCVALSSAWCAHL